MQFAISKLFYSFVLVDIFINKKLILFWIILQNDFYIEFLLNYFCEILIIIYKTILGNKM